MPPSAPVTTTVLPPAAAIIFSVGVDEKDDTRREIVNTCTAREVTDKILVCFNMPYIRRLDQDRNKAPLIRILYLTAIHMLIMPNVARRVYS